MKNPVGPPRKSSNSPVNLKMKALSVLLKITYDVENTPHNVVVPGGAATCSEGFVVCFLKVPLACWGSMAAAVQPNSLGNSKKTSYKTSLNKCPPHPVHTSLNRYFGKIADALQIGLRLRPQSPQSINTKPSFSGAALSSMLKHCPQRRHATGSYQ